MKKIAAVLMTIIMITLSITSLAAGKALTIDEAKQKARPFRVFESHRLHLFNPNQFFLAFPVLSIVPFMDALENRRFIQLPR